MNRFEYLAALKEALTGLPDEMVQAIVADYERRIVERSAAGQSEDEIMSGLGDPATAAAERRAAFQSGTVQRQGWGKKVEARVDVNRPRTASSVVRSVFSAVGLMFLNLLLLGPLAACMALLLATYVVSLVSYGVGILVVAANLAGVGGVMLNEPFEQVATQQSVTSGGFRADIGPSCIYVHGVGHPAPKGLALGIDCVTGGDEKNLVTTESRLLSGEPWSLSFIGIWMTLGGILLFLTCLAVSKWAWNGLRNLVRMEISMVMNN